MKHPVNSVLQDYFENALNQVHEGIVKDHLLNCDQCTKILSDMTLIDRKMQERRSIEVSPILQNRIFQEAGLLLREKREKIESQSAKRKRRSQKHREFFQNMRDLLNSLKTELRIPALQFCSVVLVLVAIVTAEKLSTENEYQYEPISTKVHSYDYKDTIQAEEAR